MPNEIEAGWKVRAAEIEELVLKRLDEHEQSVVTLGSGVHDARFARPTAEHLSTVCRLIAALGFKVVPERFRQIDPEAFAAFYVLYSAALKVQGDSPEFLFAD
jgi:hypothetical protein